MHLVSTRRSAGAGAPASASTSPPGETIHTENSYKYSVADFQAVARRAGFSPEAVWTDPADLFSVHLLRVPAGG